MDGMIYNELKGIREALLQLVDAVTLVADRIRPDLEENPAFSEEALAEAYKANGHSVE